MEATRGIIGGCKRKDHRNASCMPPHVLPFAVCHTGHCRRVPREPLSPCATRATVAVCQASHSHRAPHPAARTPNSRAPRTLLKFVLSIPAPCPTRAVPHARRFFLPTVPRAGAIWRIAPTGEGYRAVPHCAVRSATAPCPTFGCDLAHWLVPGCCGYYGYYRGVLHGAI